MSVRIKLVVENTDLTQTRRTIRRLVKESPSLIASELAKELKEGDSGAGAMPARADRRTGYPVRTGLARRSFRPTHDGRITNLQGYSGRLEREGKWKGATRRYIDKRLIEVAKDVRNKVLARSGRG